VFRLEPPGKEALDIESLNNLNQLFYTRISARNDILLTRTELNGIICIRFAVGCFRTEEKHVQQAFNLLCAEAELTLRTLKGNNSD
jgi:aromatic-L-amino-acid decarboxylase